MKSIMAFFIVIVFFTLSCTQKKSANEWIDITPGQNLDGWTLINLPPDQPLNEIEQWSVDAGKIRCNGKGGHEWLRYDGEEFSDFIFHVEWKFDQLDEDANYNSGVYVRNNADGTVWHQAQTGGGSGGYLFGNSPVNGDIVRYSTKNQMTTNPVKPAGEWNTFDITCNGATLSMVVNGIPTTIWENCEATEGFVGLEAEGYAVEFRNVQVKKLDDAN